jgi:DNA anti-recombination protein RmuC
MHDMVPVLTFVLDFLKSVLSDLLVDQLRAKTSLEKSRDLSYSFVASLKQLRHSSELFAAYLAEAANTPSTVGAALREQISDSVNEVSRDLVTLAEAVNRIDPQLEVHAPAVAEKINEASQRRSAVIAEVQELLDPLSSLDSHRLRELSTEADRVQQEIDGVSEELRQFVAKSIGYTDSFD